MNKEATITLKEFHFQTLSVCSQLLAGGKFNLAGNDIAVAAKAQEILKKMVEDLAPSFVDAPEEKAEEANKAAEPEPADAEPAKE